MKHLTSVCSTSPPNQIYKQFVKELTIICPEEGRRKRNSQQSGSDATTPHPHPQPKICSVSFVILGVRILTPPTRRPLISVLSRVYKMIPRASVSHHLETDQPTKKKHTQNAERIFTPSGNTSPTHSPPPRNKTIWTA